jgi:ribosomal protein S15P/S13E
MAKLKSEKKSVKSISAAEAEEQVISLANAGHSPSAIGIILRDENGVRNFKELTGHRVQAVLKENKLLSAMPEDMLNLIKKSVSLYRHMEKNKKDASAKRGYELTVSKIRRLTKYYIKTKKISEKWRYTPEEAALLVK